MHRISSVRSRKESITATYTLFNREHAGMTPVNIFEFRNNRRIFTEVIVKTGQTDRWKDWRDLKK